MTRKEDEWNCEDCGEQLGKHDMWFEGATSGRCGGCHDISEIPKFPLGVPNEMVRDFMRMDCYHNKKKYYPNAEGVQYMSGEDKSEVYQAMRETYFADEVFRNWFTTQNNVKKD